MIKAILWDVDGTLLDFSKSERFGLFACLEEIGFTAYDDEMLQRYAKINRMHWEALERGEMTKARVLQGRFEHFFETEGIACPDIASFNASYQKKLGEHFFENEDSIALCRKLKDRCRQYVVTNGTVEAQRNKLANSGLDEYVDGVFISDEIGIEKPGAGFFEHVFSEIRAQLGYLPKADEMMIVGDSLTSDIAGGNNAGILCCWYNPENAVNDKHVRVDYEIRHLWDILPVLDALDKRHKEIER